MKVQLLVFSGCPHAAAARALIERVLASNGRAEFEELDTTAEETPERLRGWGSPTILVDGVDIEGRLTPAGEGCRVYRDSDGRLQGIPPEAMLRAAVGRTEMA